MIETRGRLRRWGRLPAAALGVTVGTSALVGIPAAASANRPDTATIAWGECPSAAEGLSRDPRQTCGTLRVPLDYRRPSGRGITIAVSRIATAKPQTRRGILLFNPGGPGGEGLDFPNFLIDILPAEVLDRYDLIGFDPRGIGYSTPVTCGINPQDALETVLPYPAPDGSIEANVDYARKTAADCAAGSGDLLPFITTANTARDMDRIRKTLGERKLSYLGYSYGSYLGAVYASLFDQHTDRIVLDSAIDPALVWYQMWRTWGPAVAIRFPDAARYVAERDATFGFGATVEAVTDSYLALARRLDEAPVAVPALDLVVSGNLLREITRSALYNHTAVPALAEVWRTVADLAAGTDPADGGATLRAVLQEQRPVAAQGVPEDNDVAALYAVVCDDVNWPRDVGTYARNTAADRAAWPLTAGMPSNIWPCAFWPNRPVEAPVEVTSRGQRNILILQNRRDPATPWVSGLGMRQALGRRAAFVGVDAGGHGVYGAGSCADPVADSFLATGALPQRDVFCAGAPVSTLRAPASHSRGRSFPLGPLVPIGLPDPLGH